MTQIEPATRRRRILLYGDINLNVLDGSAVWLISMAEALSKTSSDVWVLLKAPMAHDRLAKSLDGLPGVTVVPHSDASDGGELTPRFAARRILGLDSRFDFDIIITRGFQLAAFIANSERLLAKSWPYITDLPFPSSSVTPAQLVSLDKIARGARRMFAQTEHTRSYLEALVPAAAGKTVLLTPMIPDNFILSDLQPVLGSAAKRLVYSGKFAKDWRTLEMCEVIPQLRETGVAATLTMIGDKFQDDRSDPTWPDRMREAIASPNVDWVGGMGRHEAMELMSTHHIGLGWRSAKLDSSLEISTKLLEYASAGLAPVMNRTAAHEELFGPDYPLYVEGEDLGDLLGALDFSEQEYDLARQRAWTAAKNYSISAASVRLEDAFARSEIADACRPLNPRPTRVVLAGHDFKFSGDLIELLEARTDIDLRIDKWTSLHANTEELSRELVEWADVVVCEWAGPNVVWYSKHKRPAQRLIVRLHAFELRGPWLKNIVGESVDRMVCVSDHYAKLAHEATGIPRGKISTIPNAVDVADLCRSKQEQSRFRLGLVGIVPFIKRPDRALEVLRHLLSLDERYTLHVRGRMPWEYPYEWNKPLQREAYLQFFGDLGADSELAKHVAFEPFGADMGSWLRKIGFMLSPSTRESFHLAPAEGMASGSVPVFWDRPGVREIFGSDFVVPSSLEAARMIHSLASNPVDYEAAATKAQEIASGFDLGLCANRWLSALFDDGEDD